MKGEERNNASEGEEKKRKMNKGERRGKENASEGEHGSEEKIREGEERKK